LEILTVSAGDQFGGRHKVTSRVARGAMGEAWRALDHWLDRDVAVKLMHGEYVADATFRRRFDSEAKSAARLNHPTSRRCTTTGRCPSAVRRSLTWSWSGSRDTPSPTE
jgi:serine/threonine protein kinase